MATKHLLIKGNVQGVFYRASAKQNAELLQLTGWIKNTYEGNVEAVVSGKGELLEQFIAWCKKGPEKATVTSVEIHELEEQYFDKFAIVRD